jgi:flagellar hook-associated protein 2
MGTISSGVGLISGINSGAIIDQLIALDAQPAKDLQKRIDNNKQVQTAYTDLQARLTALSLTAGQLVRPSTFQNSQATSSDPNTLSATATASAPAGVYQFTVARTVTSQSVISSGFADLNTALVGAGTIKIGLGGGEVTSSAALADLNGGAGIRRGQFRVTDKSGNSAAIDIGNAVTLDDVVKKINTSTNIQVKASIGQDGLVIDDLSGGTGTLKIDDLQGGNAAADLGIKGNGGAGTTLTGTNINALGRATKLSSLNDGLGVRTKGVLSDFSVKTADGTNVNVTLGGKKTIGDVLDTLNSAGGGKFTASIRADGKGLKIVDNTAGGGTLTVTSLGSNAAHDLGLDAAVSGNTLTGSAVRSNLGSVLLKSLKGGTLDAYGVTNIQDRSGVSSVVDFTGVESLDDVIGRINGAGTGIRASLNQSGTGLSITDTSGGTGNLSITDSTGTLAAQLGIAGTFNNGKTVIDGGGLDRQYVGENSLLADLNGGKGVSPGRFQITDAAGKTASIDTSTLQNGTLGDVIKAINSAGLGLTASVNDKGSGLLLTDTTGNATGKITVSDQSGSAARDLRISGSSTNGKIDGAYGATITVTNTDTLQNVVDKINNSTGGVTASVVNDGSGGTPYRLVVTASGAGRDGRFTFDAGSTGLGSDELVRAQDAAVFLGGTGGTGGVGGSGILVTSSTNTLANVVPGVTLNLTGVSDRPVTVNVTQTADNAVTQLQSFVKNFNDLTTKIADLTKFDTTTNAKGLLLGDATVSQITDGLFTAINAPIKNAGRYSLFSQVGLTVGADNQLSFDESKFRSAYATDPVGTQRLFTAFNTVTTTNTKKNGLTVGTDDVVTTAFGTDSSGTTVSTDAQGNTVTKTTKLVGFGLGYAIQNAIKKLTDPLDGVLSLQNKNIDQANQNYSDRIDSINTLLVAKKARLQKQFADMETTLATLQGQQSSLSKITSISASK